METKKEIIKLGFRVNILTGALVGLIGGFVIGVRDNVRVIYYHAPKPFPFFDMISFSLSQIISYALIGCLVMAAGGAVITLLLRIGGYTVNRTQLAGLYVGIFVSLAVSVVVFGKVELKTIENSLLTVGELSLVSILCGLAVAGLTVYILDKGKRDRTIATCISLSIFVFVFLHIGLWMNKNLFSELLSPVSLISEFSLLLLVGVFASGLYLLILSVMQDNGLSRNSKRRHALSLLGFTACGLVILVWLVQFKSDNVKNIKELSTIAKDGERKPLDSKDKPNVILIVMDTIRADHLSSYNYFRKTTPNIDGIAREGVLFENAISASSWTVPSHASIFTGVYPSKHGVDSEHQYLEDKFTTLAEVLRLSGYKTFGYSNNTYISSKLNMTQGFDFFEVSNAGIRKSDLSDFRLINDVTRNIKNFLGMNDAGSRETNEKVKEWIKSSYDSKKPFFLFINYMESHLPYKPPRPYNTRYLKKEDISKAKTVNQNRILYMAKKVQMNNKDFEILRTLYDGEISYVDSKINDLVDFIRQLKMLDNTILIITSDHGENIGDHNLMSHVLCLYDSLLHVPLIIRYPKLFPAGIKIKGQVQTTDIFPTILDSLNIEWKGIKEIQGHTLVPLMKGSQRNESSLAIAELGIDSGELSLLKKANPQLDASEYARMLETIRTDTFKYIWSSDGRDEFYNIREDPDELNNLINIQPEKANELRTLLSKWLNSFEHYRHNAAKRNIY